MMIAIITDSTCDIPDELIRQYGITIVPHIIIWGEEQFRDRVDMQPLEFYERLVKDPIYPSSSQAGVPDFQQAYEAAEKRGATEIITLTVSSAMSGAFRMAQEAAELVKIPVSVVDGKGPTMSLGWQVLTAARMRDAGESVKTILESLDILKTRLVQYVCMDSLDFLRKGGRIGNAVKWLGGALHIRPLVTINHQTGLVDPVSLARTHSGIVDLMYKKFFGHFQEGDKLHIAVLHGNNPAEAAQLAERIHNEFHPVELLVNITGPVLGINTGPNALALAGYAEP